jgi:hypothetical protein
VGCGVQALTTGYSCRGNNNLMTSFAFIMGVVPLVASTGAGAEMRHAMGVAVFAGMIGVTLFGIFLTPVFYVLLRQVSGNRSLKQHGEAKQRSVGVGCGMSNRSQLPVDHIGLLANDRPNSDP